MAPNEVLSQNRVAVIQFELDAELDKERTLNYMSRNKNIIAGNVGAVCFE